MPENENLVQGELPGFKPEKPRQQSKPAFNPDDYPVNRLGEKPVILSPSGEPLYEPEENDYDRTRRHSNAQLDAEIASQKSTKPTRKRITKAQIAESGRTIHAGREKAKADRVTRLANRLIGK